MPEKCPDSCPLVPRVKVLEQDNERHTQTHKEIFDRLRQVETDNAVQEAHYKAIDAKLDELTVMVKDLKDKPGKRWDDMIKTILTSIVTGIICFLLGRMGL